MKRIRQMKSTPHRACFAVVAIFLGVSPGTASAQRASTAADKPYPNRPIRFLVPFIAGVSDIYARVVGLRLQEIWKQPVIIDNRPAAGGLQAAEITAKASAD